MAVSMDDDVPLILTLDDSGSSASAPLDDLDREELPNESKIALLFPARCDGLACFSLCGGCSFLRLPGPETLRALIQCPGGCLRKSDQEVCLLCCLFTHSTRVTPRGRRTLDGQVLPMPFLTHIFCGFCVITCNLVVLKLNSPFLHIGPERRLFLALTHRAVPVA